MAKKPLPSPEVLRQLLRYDPETGKLFWRERGEEWFLNSRGRYTPRRSAHIWNVQFAGRTALDGIDGSNGYRKGTIFGSKTYAHRAIWALQTGAWPEGDIDHINGDRADNRWRNLRSVSRRINTKNAKRRSTNTSGMMGVLQYGERGRWRAFIYLESGRKHLGCFDTFLEACAARKAAEAEFGFHKNHGRN